MGIFVQGTPLEGRYQPGDDFQEAFREYVSPWASQINVRPGDLGTLTWSDGPIEFLFVDAMKSLALANNIVQQFFSSLMPGVSLVFHHDFAHYYTPWIPLLMHRFRDYLRLVRPIPRTAVLFQAVSDIPTPLLRHTWSFADFDDAEVDQAFAYAASCIGPEGSAGLRASRLMLRVHQGDLERAAWERDQVPSGGVRLGGQLCRFRVRARRCAREPGNLTPETVAPRKNDGMTGFSFGLHVIDDRAVRGADGKETAWSRFGQADHVRRYDRDGFLEPLREAGFVVTSGGRVRSTAYATA